MRTAEEWCAIHEAGHACHAFLIRIQIYGIWIEHTPTNPHPNGRVETALPPERVQFALLCSGFLAETLFGRDEREARQTTDTQKLLEMSSRFLGFDQVPGPGTSDLIDVQEQINAVQLLVLDLLDNVTAKDAIASLSKLLLAQPPTKTSEVKIGVGFPAFPLSGEEVRMLNGEVVTAELSRFLKSNQLN